MKFRPEEGLHVTVRGSISVYEARGEYQIYVETIEPVGLGALQLAFEQLKKRLQAEGLFAADRKKPLPLLPSRSSFSNRSSRFSHNWPRPECHSGWRRRRSLRGGAIPR